jgi:alginate O-acetyltransferase complex protein AlgI
MQRHRHQDFIRFLNAVGGSRTGLTAANLMITMLLGGLWHGAGWGFTIWGGIHGVGLVIERLFPRRNRAGSWLVTQLLVTVAWVPQRSSAAARSRPSA